jgi:hypothetical protein
MNNIERAQIKIQVAEKFRSVTMEGYSKRTFSLVAVITFCVAVPVVMENSEYAFPLCIGAFWGAILTVLVQFFETVESRRNKKEIFSLLDKIENPEDFWKDPIVQKVFCGTD